MGRFFMILPILAFLGISLTLISAEFEPVLEAPPQFQLNPGEATPISGPRLRRQYFGGPYEYQYQGYQGTEYPYQEYSYKPSSSNYRAPILASRAHASARNLAAYLAATTGDDDDYCPPNNPRVNKKASLKIFQEVVGNKITRNMDKYFHPSYIQHNPVLPDGREALRKALQPGGVFFGPREQIDFQHVAADGDLVWMHQKRVRANGEIFAHVDIFRWECGKIAEHWDVIQSTELDTPALNEHPFF